MNNITEKASNDAYSDETIWAFLDMFHVVIGLQASLESTIEVRQSCFTMLTDIIQELTPIDIHKLRSIHGS